MVEREEIAEQMEKGWAPRGLRGIRDLSANITREYLLLGAVWRELRLQCTICSNGRILPAKHQVRLDQIF